MSKTFLIFGLAAGLAILTAREVINRCAQVTVDLGMAPGSCNWTACATFRGGRSS